MSLYVFRYIKIQRQRQIQTNNFSEHKHSGFNEPTKSDRQMGVEMPKILNQHFSNNVIFNYK